MQMVLPQKSGLSCEILWQNANLSSKPSAKQLDANVTVSSNADKYIAAVGVKRKLIKIQYAKFECYCKKSKEWNLPLKTYKVGGKFFMDVSMQETVCKKLHLIVLKDIYGSSKVKNGLHQQMATKFAKKSEIFPN